MHILRLTKEHVSICVLPYLILETFIKTFLLLLHSNFFDPKTQSKMISAIQLLYQCIKQTLINLEIRLS